MGMGRQANTVQECISAKDICKRKASKPISWKLIQIRVGQLTCLRLRNFLGQKKMLLTSSSETVPPDVPRTLLICSAAMTIQRLSSASSVGCACQGCKIKHENFWTDNVKLWHINWRWKCSYGDTAAMFSCYCATSGETQYYWLKCWVKHEHQRQP